MASVRIETVADETSGLVRAEVYVDGAAAPALRSDAAFATHEDLIREIVDMCRTRFPDHMPLVEDPTIGV